MRKTFKYLLLLAVLVVTAFPSLALSTSYSFSSWDSSGIRNDLNDLDHNYLYMWGINASQLQNQRVVSATIHFNNIQDWRNEPDILKFYLLDNLRNNDNVNSVDIIQIPDGSGINPANEIPFYEVTKFSDFTKLGSWTDPDNDPAGGYTFDFTFNADQLTALNAYLLTLNHGFNSTFGLGFDPDCHYYNDGITLNIETAPVPEPGTLLLLGSGLVGMFSYGRRRMKS
jgi:hypothetical protein